MSYNYKATYLPTGLEYFFKTANIELAWQKSIEMFKEELLRELLPTFLDSPDSLPSFKLIRASDLIQVVTLDQFKIIIYGDNGIDVLGCMDNPMMELLESGFDFRLKPKDIELLDSWLVEQFTESRLTSFTIELARESNNPSLVTGIKIVRV